MNMSENTMLDIEPFSEDQRVQLPSELHAAMNAEKAAFNALDAHWQSNPVKWKLWGRPPVEWKQTESQLMENYKQACLTLSQLKNAQTPGRANARYKALKFGGILAVLFFVGIFGLAANDFFRTGQAGWLATFSALLTCIGAGGALICAFIFAD
jgi:hypothetical protein